MKSCLQEATHRLYDSGDRLWGEVCYDHALEGARYIDYWEMMIALQTTSLAELVPSVPQGVRVLEASTT
jgi:hypothetical protein